jgi:hypothetical protein
VRYSGSSGYAAIDLNSSDLSLANCTLRDGDGHALDLSATSFPLVADCTFTNHATAVEGIHSEGVTKLAGVAR